MAAEVTVDLSAARAVAGREDLAKAEHLVQPTC